MILQALMNIPMAVRDLCLKLNFHSWVAATVQFKKLTRWQLGFLTQIFVDYIIKIKNMLFEGVEDISREKLSGRYLRTEVLIKSSLKKVALILILEDDEVKEKWMPRLEKLNQPWTRSEAYDFQDEKEGEKMDIDAENQVENNTAGQMEVDTVSQTKENAAELKTKNTMNGNTPSKRSKSKK